MRKMHEEQFEHVYNKLRRMLAIGHIHPEEKRPNRVSRQDGVAYALRWNSSGPQPTEEQFALAYELEMV